MSRKSIFVDTGAWFAYINARDPDHQRVQEFFDSYPGHLVTSSYVFDETVTLTLARLGHQTAVTVGKVRRTPVAGHSTSATTVSVSLHAGKVLQRTSTSYVAVTAGASM